MLCYADVPLEGRRKELDDKLDGVGLPRPGASMQAPAQRFADGETSTRSGAKLLDDARGDDTDGFVLLSVREWPTVFASPSFAFSQPLLDSCGGRRG